MILIIAIILVQLYNKTLYFNLNKISGTAIICKKTTGKTELSGVSSYYILTIKEKV